MKATVDELPSKHLRDLNTTMMILLVARGWGLVSKQLTEATSTFVFAEKTVEATELIFSY